MTTTQRHDKPALTPRSMVGIFIIVIGVVLVLDRLRIIDATALQPYWPLGVIAIGAVLFLQGRAQGGHGINGAIAMGIGVWLLVNTLGVARVHFWDLFGPLLLIGIGWALVKQRGWPPGLVGTPEAEGHLVIFAVLSGVKRASTASHFNGAEITTFMGGCQLDLRQAVLAPGEQATIEIMSWMGGCEVFVPPSWDLVTPVIPVMGAVEDKRLPPLPVASPSGHSMPAPRLVIRGFMLMSGVQIKG